MCHEGLVPETQCFEDGLGLQLLSVPTAAAEPFKSPAFRLNIPLQDLKEEH